MAQEEALRLLSKTDAEGPSKETLVGFCRSAAVRAISLASNLPGHGNASGSEKRIAKQIAKLQKGSKKLAKQKHKAKLK